MPQDITVRADISRDDTIVGCTVFLVWRSPSNLAPEDISHYNIYINGSSTIIRDSIADERLIVFSYRECNASCATSLIGVSAVNRCFREGEISNITLDQRSLSMSECERVSTVSPPDTDICRHIKDERHEYIGKGQS